MTDQGNSRRRLRQGGSTILEFGMAMSFLVPLFAGMFSIGMTLTKGVQVSNVCEDAVLLAVASVTDPQSGLDLSQTQNQQIIVKAASGLGMNTGSTFTPNPNGNAVVVLTKVVKVGPTECSQGIVPAPSGVPTTTPWSASNCPNFGQYAFAYRVAFGNTGRWTSTLGNPPSGVVQTNGTISPANIAANTSNVSSTAANIIPLLPSSFGLVSEMWADVSNLNILSIWHAPVIYSRSIS